MAARIQEMSDKESFVGVAEYIGSLIDGGEEGAAQAVDTPGAEYAAECRQLSEASDYPALLTKLIEKLDLLFEKAENEKDLEGSLAIIVHLIPSRLALLAPASVPAASEALASSLASSAEPHPAARLQALISLYNAVADAGARHGALLRVLDAAEAGGLADALLPAVRAGADGWARDLGLTASQERRLLARAADVVAGARRQPRAGAREARRLRSRLVLSLPEGAPAEELSTTLPAAAALAAELAASPDALTFDLLAAPAVKALEAGSDERGRRAFKLLTAYAAGTPSDVSALLEADAGLAPELGLEPEAALEKARLLALLSAAAAAPDARLGYDEAAAAVGAASDADVERAVVRACARGALEARMDAVERVVSVSRVSPRTFGESEWQQLRARLAQWRDVIDRVRATAADQQGLLANGLTAIKA